MRRRIPMDKDTKFVLNSNCVELIGKKEHHKQMSRSVLIEPNYGNVWEDGVENQDLICLGYENEDSKGRPYHDSIGLTLKDAQFVINSLTEIVKFYKEREE